MDLLRLGARLEFRHEASRDDESVGGVCIVVSAAVSQLLDCVFRPPQRGQKGCDALRSPTSGTSC